MTPFGLELEGVSKSYGDAPIIDDISFQVPEGEMLVLVGPSGSGKSTLLRLIAGLVQHDGGEIRIGGRDVAASRRRNATRPWSFRATRSSRT